MITPDVFWSDIVLGAVALGCAARLRSHPAYGRVFVFLAAATWVGAFYHGFINTTANLSGDILWSITLLLFFLASAAIIDALLPGRITRLVLAVLFGAYTYWAIFVSEKFIWALLIQGICVIAYLVATLYDVVRSQRSLPALGWLLVFIVVDGGAIFVQQSQQTFGLGISHNTIFHIIEIPALVALALSMHNRARIHEHGA